MAYLEIVNEIQEQIDDLHAQHSLKQTEITNYQQSITELEENLTNISTQIQNLQGLKEQAQQLSDTAGNNVTINMYGSSIVDHTVS